MLVKARWPEGVICPQCGSHAVRYLSNQSRWQCKSRHSRRQFSVKVGTVLEDSAIRLDKWLEAIWLIDNAENSISSYKLGRSIGITQKSAWFVLHRIRLTMQTATFANSTYMVGNPSDSSDSFRKFLSALMSVPEREIDDQDAVYHREREIARARAERRRTQSQGLRQQRAEFDSAHRQGMASFATRDFEALERAIHRERAVIEALRRDVRERLNEFKRWRRQTASVRSRRR